MGGLATRLAPGATVDPRLRAIRPEQSRARVVTVGRGLTIEWTPTHCRRRGTAGLRVELFAV
jgi:hypothetical protein